LLIGLALKEKVSISICSVAYPHLRKGAIRDFMEIMEANELYNPNDHIMTESLYRYPNGSYIEFFSVDNSLKVRGPGRDILFINEANLIAKDTFEQLNMRTRRTVFMDYNPADENHWIYDRILPLADTAFIQTTFLDNPFLPDIQRKQIEDLKEADENLWKVYGLGERGTTQETIYSGWNITDKMPETDYAFGLDFGFRHPTSLVRCYYQDGSLYFKQEVYQSNLTSIEIATMIKPIVERKYVYCDHARPEIIQDLRKAGINAVEANKNVKEGIDWIRANKVFVHNESTDLQKELRSYKWKTKPDGTILDEPVKAFDDAVDAARYVAISFKNKQSAPVLTFHR
jgi:phage terminase large subunit